MGYVNIFNLADLFVTFQFDALLLSSSLFFSHLSFDFRCLVSMKLFAVVL